MSMPRSVAFIGNHLPRRCGIATFTHDLHRAVAMACPGHRHVRRCDERSGRRLRLPVVRAISGSRQHPPRLPQGGGRLERCRRRCRFAAARIRDLRRRGRRQHPGVGVPAANADRDDAAHRACGTITRPACRPAADHRCSARLVRHVGQGAYFLRSVHGVPAEKIEIIPHGIPEFPFIEPKGQAEFGFSGKSVILTFGCCRRARASRP